MFLYINDSEIETCLNIVKKLLRKKGKIYIKDLPFSDIKATNISKNMIYVGDGCAGIFNGYVSWVRNIGRCFGKKYEITLLYDFLTPEMAKSFGDLNIKW